MEVVVSRFQVYLVRLDPTEGREIRKTRPCLIVSPDEMNLYIGTVMVAPMTTREHPYPTRIPVQFRGRRGQVALDQIRAVDKRRLLRYLGSIDTVTARRTLSVLGEMFKP